VAKPHVDSGLLLHVLVEHKGLVKDLGVYERISSTASPDVAGLANLHDLCRSWLRVAPGAEMYSMPLKNALLQLCALHPEVNGTKFNGDTWATLRVERLTVVMSHLRYLARHDEALIKASSNLTAV